MKQIICVHVGEKYSNQYVEKLYRAVRRQMCDPCLFTVLTDNKQYDISDPNFRSIIVNPLPVGPEKMWWYKMEAFRPDVVVAGENLLCDIDIVICNSLDKFWNYHPEEFVIIQDFNRLWYPNYNRNNSSVVKFDQITAAKIWNLWSSDSIGFVRKYRGDQDWFDGELTDMRRWPTKWILSWKWEVFNGGLVESGRNKYHSNETILDHECSILSFHGKPDPADVDHEIVHRHWI